jgi:hypothetical protein
MVHNSSKMKSHKEVAKQKLKFFFLFLLDDPDPGGPKLPNPDSGTLAPNISQKKFSL